jgi:hypothetical protein
MSAIAAAAAQAGELEGAVMDIGQTTHSEEQK